MLQYAHPTDREYLLDAMEFVRCRFLRDTVQPGSSDVQKQVDRVLKDDDEYRGYVLGNLVKAHGQEQEFVVTRFLPYWEALSRVGCQRIQTDCHYFEVKEGGTTSFRRAVTADEAAQFPALDLVSWERPDARLALLKYCQRASSRRNRATAGHGDEAGPSR